MMGGSILLTHKISNSAACTTLRRPPYTSPNVDLEARRPTRHTYTHRTLIVCMNTIVYLFVCVCSFVIHIIIMHFGLFLLFLLHTHTNKLTRTCKHTARTHTHTFILATHTLPGGFSGCGYGCWCFCCCFCFRLARHFYSTFAFTISFGGAIIFFFFCRVFVVVRVFCIK